MVTICDVGPRDGLQNEPEVLSPTERADLVNQRADLVNRLAAARLPRIEAASFVRGDLVPQMAGAEEVAGGIDRRPGVEYTGLVLNERGYDRLLGTQVFVGIGIVLGGAGGVYIVYLRYGRGSRDDR